MRISHKPTTTLVAYNETLRNTLMRVLEALGIEVKGIQHTNQLDISKVTSNVVIVCPVSQYEEGHSIALHDAPKDGDDLQTVWRCLTMGLKTRPNLKSIVLCPLTQLSQATEFWRLPGCSVVSRPVRLRVLRDTLMQTLILEHCNSSALEDSMRFQQSEAAKMADAALFPYK